MKKHCTRFLCIGIALSLLSPIPARAEELIPPPPIQSAAETGGTLSPSGSAGDEEGGRPGPGVSSAPEEDKTAAAILQPPVIRSEGAVLMDAATGKVLYAKNENLKFYPASITKLMTALLVTEHCGLDETVTFSETATTNLESGSVTLNLTAGDKLTVRQCLYALLLKSANEVANGLAEHVSGSVAKFADLMNAKAKALGCTGTHFANPNGLNDSNHYTTPRDMALIARAAFENATVLKIASTLSYEIPATKKAKARTITMGHKMLNPKDSRYYPGVIGGKTGYTSLAGNTLVTGAERDGVRLIAVVMKGKTTHYADTAALLDYGFDNWQALNAGSAASKARWVSEGTRWYYIKADGNRAADEWQTIGGEDYWFDSDGCMATGWRQFNNGAWYYFKSGGAMARSCWEQNLTGAWFYLGADGAMLTNTTTPDGYWVNEYGEWKP